MEGRGPNAIDMPRPPGENEPRFHEVRRWQWMRAIGFHAPEDHRDGLLLATLTRPFVPTSCPRTPRIGRLREY